MQKHKGKEITESGEAVGLLISMLLAYPEITLINYMAEDQVLKLTFLLSSSSDTDTSVFASLRKNILIHSEFKRLKARTIELTTDRISEYTYLHVFRDLESFTKEEINLMITWLADNHFGFITEADSYPALEEDLTVHEDLITPMLVAIRNRKYQSTFIAYRDNGKVLVFNK